MNIENFHKNFKIALDKVDSEAYSELLPSEIDVFLNKAIVSFVKTRYGRNNLYKKGFETLQKRIEDLKAIVVTTFSSFSEEESIESSKIFKINLSNMFLDKANTVSFDGNYWFFVSALAKTKDSLCETENVVRIVTHDQLGVVLKDPFNKPSLSNPIILFEEDNIKVLTGQSDLIDFRLTFIKKPNEVCLGTYKNKPKVECDLSEHTHEEIITLAVELALEAIGSPRLNTIQAVKSQSE